MWGVLRPLRRVLRWAAVSALLISISWQKWQHEKSIEMISDRLMDGFIFFQEKFRTNSRRFFFSTFQLVCEPFWSLLVSSRYPSLIISLLLQNNVPKRTEFSNKNSNQLFGQKLEFFNRMWFFWYLLGDEMIFWIKF